MGQPVGLGDENFDANELLNSPIKGYVKLLLITIKV